MPARPLTTRLPSKLLLSIPLLFSIAACDRKPDGDAPDTATPATAAAPAPGTTADMVSAADTAGSASNAALPIAPDAIAYFGFKAAPFGADEKMLRSAWNGELTTQGPQQADGCYTLHPANSQDAAGRHRIGFMVDGSRFSRIDVDDPTLVAPGGGKIGMSTHEIATLYTQRLQVQPHKYVDGAHYLRVPDAGGSDSVLLFETDVEGLVTRWRIGHPPQIDYVEGCA